MSPGDGAGARVRRAAVLLGLWILVWGCASPPPGEWGSGRHAAPLAGRAYEPLGRDFFLRQSVLARADGEQRRFEIALVSQCDELRLVALTPFGLRLFSAVRNRDGLEVESLAGQQLPFDPEHVLRDVERTFFRSAPRDRSEIVDPAARDAAPPAQERTVHFAGERIVERFEQDQLVSREVFADDEGGSPSLQIAYGGPVGPAGIRERVEVRNPLLGYVLEIHNFEVSELECAARP